MVKVRGPWRVTVLRAQEGAHLRGRADARSVSESGLKLAVAESEAGFEENLRLLRDAKLAGSGVDARHHPHLVHEIVEIRGAHVGKNVRHLNGRGDLGSLGRGLRVVLFLHCEAQSAARHAPLHELDLVGGLLDPVLAEHVGTDAACVFDNRGERVVELLIVQHVIGLVDALCVVGDTCRIPIHDSHDLIRREPRGLRHRRRGGFRHARIKAAKREAACAAARAGSIVKKKRGLLRAAEREAHCATARVGSAADRGARSAR